jgi:hypothetical protein
MHYNVDGKKVTIKLTDIYYVPGWKLNIISYSRLAQYVSMFYSVRTTCV